MTELTPENFDHETSSGAVLVDFWSPSCAPCRMLAPILEKIDEAVPELKICKVNVMDGKDLAVSHGVNALPTMIYYVNGVEKTRLTGLYPGSKIIEVLIQASRV